MSKIRSHLAKLMVDVCKLPVENIYQSICSPPEFKMGHFAFPCFPLAKSYGMRPDMVARELAVKINKTADINASPQGPYLNFTLSPSVYGSLVLVPILNKTLFKEKPISHPQTIMIEYSQPNTHKQIHVGHMRNLSLGNALVRIRRYLGDSVISATYPGDTGTHVAKCLWYLKRHPQDSLPQQKGVWLGKIYALAVSELDKDESDKEKNKKELGDILRQIEEKKGDYFKLWKKTRLWSLDLMKEIYNWADVSFDRWYFESEVDGDSLIRTRKYFKEGAFIESQGAIGMDLSEDDLGFCMMIKSDGTGMYATKDMELAFRKFSDYSLDKSVYLVDKRQTRHFKQIFKMLKKLGFPHADKCLHLPYDFVELPSGVMSSRKGTIIPLTDLISQMENKIIVDYLDRHRHVWKKEEIDQVAKMVADGAIKYGMLRMDHKRKIVFHMEEWLKLDGETGPYLQYVYARICSLTEKQGYDEKKTVHWPLLTSCEELELMAKLSWFHDVLYQAGVKWKVSVLCTYLYELGKLFNTFYAKCPISTADDSLKNTRLALAKACGLVMEKGLDCLGIASPSKM